MEQDRYKDPQKSVVSSRRTPALERWNGGYLQQVRGQKGPEYPVSEEVLYSLSG